MCSHAEGRKRPTLTLSAALRNVSAAGQQYYNQNASDCAAKIFEHKLIYNSFAFKTSITDSKSVFPHSVKMFLSQPCVCLCSELVPALVRVFPQPSSEHPEHGRERSGSPRQGAAAAPGGLWRHFTGNLSLVQPHW